MEDRKVINFDARCLQDLGYRSSGIGTYARWLLGRLRESQGFRVKLVVHPEDRYFMGLSEGPDVEMMPWGDMDSGIYFNPSLMTHGSDPLDLARARGLTTVGVIHDLIPLRRPSESSDYDLKLFKGMLDKSRGLDGIVTNSLCTLADYRSWREADTPSFVIHPGSRFEGCRLEVAAAKDVVRSVLKIDSPYVFFAVADHPRKNMALALRAAPALRAVGFATVVGGGVSAATVRHLGRSHDLSAITFTPRLSDHDLAATYVGAEAVVVPSFDEGFSLPVTEALNLGCKVVASAIPAHREQVLDSRRLFEPDDLDGFLASFHAALSCMGTRHVTFEHSREIACFLDWLENRPPR